FRPPPHDAVGVSDAAIFFFSSRRRHTRFSRDWSSDVCSSDLVPAGSEARLVEPGKAGFRFFDMRIHDLIQHSPAHQVEEAPALRSEERRVGKECRSRWWPHLTMKKMVQKRRGARIPIWLHQVS